MWCRTEFPENEMLQTQEKHNNKRFRETALNNLILFFFFNLE